MKHSKLFLGLTSGLLAIVGLAAAKAHRTNIPACVYTSVNKQVCVKAPNIDNVTLTAPSVDAIIVVTAVHNYTLFTYTTPIPRCVIPLYVGNL